jgi:glycosyltransferase involved in cell wall biosynthesis
MQLIWLGHFIPFPPRGGAHQRSYHLLRQASRNHEIILVAFNRPPVDAETLEAYRAGLAGFCTEIQFWDMPFAWKGLRWWAGLAANTVQLLPYSCEVYRSRVLLTRWNAILQAHPDAIIHVDSSDLAVYAQAAAGRRILLNHHNCESAMAVRRAALEPNIAKKLAMSTQARKQAALEGRLCAQVAVNAVVSAVDGDSLRLQCPTAQVHVVENGTDTDYFVPQPQSIEPNSLVFAGSMNWYPNISGLRYFRERIWQRLKSEVAGIKLFVAGFSPGLEMREWANSEPALTLVANPDDIRPWIAKGAVFICPIIDGGGTRLKLLDAMSAGKAIVSTKIGAEGINIENGKQALLADSEDEFVELVLTALRSVPLQQSLAQNARQFVQENYSWEIIGRSLENAYLRTAGTDGEHPNARNG